MRRSGVKKLRIEFVIPLLILIFGMSVVLYAARVTRRSRREQAYATAELNAVSYSQRMIEDMERGIYVTEALEQIIISENGKLDGFQKIAQNLISEHMQSVQLAPDGIVTEIYPEAGNEASKIDLFSDPVRGQIVRYGRDHDMVTLQGPLDLKQGGRGLAVRNPVFLEDENGTRTFWGFTVVIIRVPEIFADSIRALTGFGYEYRLSKDSYPISTDYEVVDSSGTELEDPASYSFKIGNCAWKLEVAPINGWKHSTRATILLLCCIAIVLLSVVLSVGLLILEERRRFLRKIATTDALTGLLNRHGVDNEMARYLEKRGDEPCVGVLIDVDDFKFINDVYGHATGDEVLRLLADQMRAAFPDNAILSRIGGDEFCVILKNTTCAQAEILIHCFATEPRTFSHGAHTHEFGISVGYADASSDPHETQTLISRADMALYEVKLSGKHGMMAYRPDLYHEKRSQLGFALRDVSENLPGAFLIYRADPANDEMLFANDEMIQFAGCSDFDEFMTFCGRRFSGLLHPDDIAKTEESIWRQINAQTDGANDYVRFRFAMKDGSYRPVLDHGRIVDNSYYGRVFYVLIMDCARLQEHYDSDWLAEPTAQ